MDQIQQKNLPTDQEPSLESEKLNQSDELKFLTYNFFLRPPPIHNNKDDRKNERLKLFIETQLSRFDVICCQEVFGFFNSRKECLIFEAMKKGFYYHAAAPPPSFFSSCLVDGGHVTLSRYPIVKTDFVPFKYGVITDNLAYKGFLYTKIEYKQGYLHVFNTHLQASYVGKEDDVKCTVVTRIEQMQLFKKVLNKHLKDKENFNEERDLCLIAADMNINGKQKDDEKHPIYFLDYYKDIKDHFSLLDSNSEKKSFKDYDIMRYLLSDQEKDLFYDHLRMENDNKAQVTYAESYFNEANEEIPMETICTDHADLCSNQNLDYIIQVKPGSPIERDAEYQDRNSKLFVKKGTTKVEKFLVDNPLVTQLSDHYGISTVIKYKE